MKKFIKCFSQDKSDKLKNNGFKFLYERNGVFYFENDDKLTVKFSSSNILENTKITTTVNF